jgi:predicted transcriptional regulator
MAQPNEHRLSRRERQIMDILHARQQATAAEVLDDLPDPPSYSAVRALLRILEEKGHARHRQEGNRYVYLPRASRQTASRSALKRVVSTFFQGSVAQAMAALLEDSDTRLSDAELDQMRQLIERANKQDPT